MVGKTAVCGLNLGSVSPVFSCIGTVFRIRQQHLKRGNSRIAKRYGGTNHQECEAVDKLESTPALVSYRIIGY